MTRARRASRRQLWLGAAVVATVAVVAWLSTVAIDGLPWSSPYTVRLVLAPGAPLLHPGDEVRIGGERVGQVESVALAPGASTRAVATLSLSGGYDIGPGAAARIRPRGLAGAVYVDLLPGARAHPLRSGSLVHAGAGVQLTDVISGFDADARRALAQTLTGYGTGLAGRGVEAGDAIDGAPDVLADATSVFTALTPRPGSLADAIGEARDVAGALAPAGSTTLAELVSGARRTLDATGQSAGAIAATIGALPATERTSAAVLPGADVLLARLGSAADALEPAVGAVTAALPGVQALERSAPSISALSEAAGAAGPAFSALTPALSELVGPASGLAPMSAPVAALAKALIPYRTELVQAPLGFTRWGNFAYDFGTGAGHRAVRFSMVFTCATARDPYPAPGAASRERRSCP
jgi:phospholipid/cholesterol/gamma-HCH transport system substrate-binding protein